MARISVDDGAIVLRSFGQMHQLVGHSIAIHVNASMGVAVIVVIIAFTTDGDIANIVAVGGIEGRDFVGA